MTIESSELEEDSFKQTNLTMQYTSNSKKSSCRGYSQTTLYSIRQYWLLVFSQENNQKLRKMFQSSPPSTNYQMRDLPTVRVIEAPPFTNVSIDYCGPFFVKERKVRNRSRIKVYVLVCLAMKAVHLELTSDLTTEAFLASLKKFIARRGKCRNVEFIPTMAPTSSVPTRKDKTFNNYFSQNNTKNRSTLFSTIAEYNGTSFLHSPQTSVDYVGVQP
ncbi:hypothetical protein QLX08_005923 [Tetragonisca angustula]|uniref:Uncharacterized protein n=1 Tax=Tetragonisca angustula TaxID=166442 RepID=A0AAW0ZWF3_9HYME